MRLIDADMLKDDGANYVYERSLTHDIVETEYRFVDRLQIDAAPTIEAIPIEWLDMFMQRYKIQGDDEYKLLHFMVTEWKKWEKENEKETEESH